MPDRPIDDEELADAWCACIARLPSAPPAGGQLARALLIAARWSLCRAAHRREKDHQPRPMQEARRMFCLLQIALRSGAYDPDHPDERQVWAALQRWLPERWAKVLAQAAEPSSAAPGSGGQVVLRCRSRRRAGRGE